MTGTLHKRKTKKGEIYYTVLYYYDEHGNRTPKWQTTGLPIKGNKGRAEEILRKRLVEAEAEEKRKKEAKAGENILLFSDWIRQWLEQAKRRVENNTWRQYEDISRRHVLPYFDDMGIVLEAVSRETLQPTLTTRPLRGV